ncbi:protein LATERAL ORGAN BOUNDARIES-like [Amaranthus tricolor]|uniref:protein LATERAL ORGAN BOUNDARIES-like n=1 Tax=Amaranthus tricolor TaxID=29722 RepID=UPI00258BF378|nr:protein LATERAL ORGAN BOUNDARIES-like [Amaranthus tricolor]
MASSSSYNSPCAACKFLRRKCTPGCIFAPYFPPEEPQKFANVHKIFGASNVTKLLNELLPHQREDAVNSLAYEAEARVRDPVYGCVGAISYLQRQVQRLQKELDAANADLLRYACHDISSTTAALQGIPPPPPPPPRPTIDQFGGFYQPSDHNYTYPILPWSDMNVDQRGDDDQGNNM